jgi:hypothetical protein
MFKDIRKMYIYIPLTLILFVLVLRGMIMQTGGKEPIKAQNLNVKNIRQTNLKCASWHAPGHARKLQRPFFYPERPNCTRRHADKYV